jgi:hypothetical protein
MMIAPGAIARAELAYVNYWNLTTDQSPVELHLDRTPVTRQYLPGEITPSQPVPAGQHAIWLSRPRQQLSTVQMEAGQFYTVVLLQQASTLKGIVLNDKLVRSEPMLRLVNLTTGNVRVNISTMAPLEIKPGEQQDVPVTITNDSAVGLVTVNVRSRSGPTASTQEAFGVGPDHASVLLIDQSGSGLRLTRWQYDQCAVRIATFDYEDACGHSD